jgi:ATP-dependent Lon protease
VDWYDDVFRLVFSDVDESEANQLWKKELRRPPKEEREDDDKDSAYESSS